MYLLKRIFYMAVFLHSSIACLSQNGTSYRLINDTLFANNAIRFFIGQKLQAGRGAGQNGWYEQIGFKSPLNWSLLLFHDSEIKNSYSNSGTPEVDRQNDKLKGLLNIGDTLSVINIKKRGSKRYGYWYYVILKQTKFPHTNFNCNIELAIKNKEIVTPK
jgi:hypothetical protein